MSNFYGGFALPYESNVYYVIMQSLPGVKKEQIDRAVTELIDISDSLREHEMNFFLGCQRFNMEDQIMMVFYWEYVDDWFDMDPDFKEAYKNLLELLEPVPYYMGHELVWGNEREVLYSGV
jgi:hypothetical protein